MKLSVYIQGREVAILEQVGDFKGMLAYGPQATESDLVSLSSRCGPNLTSGTIRCIPSSR
jgi:hypothetical protein